MLATFAILALAAAKADIALGESVYACKVKRSVFEFYSKPASPDDCKLLLGPGTTWIPFFAAADGTLYTFDEAAVEARGDQRTVWMREDFSVKPRRIYLVERVAIQSTRLRIECRSNTYQELAFRAWNTKGVEVIKSDEARPVETLVPGTIAAELARFVCGKPASYFGGY